MKINNGTWELSLSCTTDASSGTAYTYTTNIVNSTVDNTSNNVWTTRSIDTYPDPYIDGAVSIDPQTYPVHWPAVWPSVPNAIGLLYIEDNKIKIKTQSGDDIVLANLDDSEEEITINFMAVIAKRKLLELSEKSD